MKWILAVQEGFVLYPYHNSTNSILDLLTMILDRSLSSAPKVLRWAVRISAYNYVAHRVSA